MDIHYKKDLELLNTETENFSCKDEEFKKASKKLSETHPEKGDEDENFEPDRLDYVDNDK